MFTTGRYVLISGLSLAVGVAGAGCNLADPVEAPPVRVDVGSEESGVQSDVADGRGDTCLPETDEEACRRQSAECGDVTSRCGETVTCGPCPSGEFCEGQTCIECRDDGDCDADACEECDAGDCVTTCTRECETCDGSGSCIDSDDFCDEEDCETCTTGFCTSTCSGCLACQSGSCVADDAKCDDSEVCCQDSGRCRSDETPLVCEE